MNLLEAPEGREIEIKKINAGAGLRLRLSELGIFEGSKALVLHNRNGPVILKIFGSTLAIGRGQAERMEVVV